MDDEGREYVQETTLRPDKSAVIPVNLTGIPGAGRYDMKLRFAAAGYQPIDKDLTLYVRSPAWLAFLLVSLGVCLSFCIHAYGSIRPRLLVQRRHAGLREQLAMAKLVAGDDADGLALVEAVERAMQSVWEQARSGLKVLSGEFDVYEEVQRRRLCVIHLSRSLECRLCPKTSWSRDRAHREVFGQSGHRWMPSNRRS